MHIIDENQNEFNKEQIDKLRKFLFVNRFLEKERLTQLAVSLAEILKNEQNDSEDMLRKLIALNEDGVFDKIGVGFLISLLPEDKIQELVYLKLDVIGKDLKPISAEVGFLNYNNLYKELTEVQSRLSNRSYDLRLSDEDNKMEENYLENNLENLSTL
jgi:hypothetical protein